MGLELISGLVTECGSGAVQGQCRAVYGQGRGGAEAAKGQQRDSAGTGQSDPVRSDPVRSDPVRPSPARAFPRAAREAPAAGPARSHVTASHAGILPRPLHGIPPNELAGTRRVRVVIGQGGRQSAEGAGRGGGPGFGVSEVGERRDGAGLS